MANEGAGFEWLPDSFRNCVVEYNVKDDGGFQAIVRTNAATKEDMAQWLCDFERRTKTKWLVRSTFPNIQRLSYRIDYVCQRSSFNKHDTQRASKNCKCCAKLTLKVNVLTRQTKRSNLFVKDGLPGVVELKNIHNHSLTTATALLHLPPTPESRQLFEGYFSNGMSVSQAVRYHKTVLERSSDASEMLLVDGSLNPKYSAVRWWYDKWRQRNPGPQTGTAVLEVLEEEELESSGEQPLDIPSMKNSDLTAKCSVATHMSVQTPESADDVTADVQDSNFSEVIEKMCQFNECFQSTSASTRKILKRLNSITTAAQWETFLQTQGMGGSCAYGCSSVIPVQPTALSRRQRVAALKRYRHKHQHTNSMKKITDNLAVMGSCGKTSL